MTEHDENRNLMLRKWMTAGAGAYGAIILSIALIYQPRFPDVLVALLGGGGAWIILFNYLTKADISYASWQAKDGAAPITRLLLALFSLLWIVLYPWSLID